VKPPIFEYVRPQSVDEAVAVLGERADDAKVLAGGQSLVALMNLRLSSPGTLVDISRLPDLRTIEPGAAGLRIGAAVTQAEVEDTHAVRDHCPLLADAIPLVAHREIRNAGTVCGSAAHGDPAAEVPAVALALDATFVARSVRGTRTIEAGNFFLGFLTTALEADELLTELQFPPTSAGTGVAFEELSPRHGDYGIVGVAVSIALEGGVLRDAAIAFSGVDSVPVRAAEAEALLRGYPPSEAALAEAAHVAARGLEPQADLQGSPEYRRHLAAVLTKRALARAVGRVTNQAA
jgi:carbon-monoxide dehydrogenase medium subunit